MAIIVIGSNYFDDLLAFPCRKIISSPPALWPYSDSIPNTRSGAKVLITRRSVPPPPLAKKAISVTFAGETEAAEPVTVLVLAVLPRRHLRRDVWHVQEGVALPLMRVMHALPSPAASPPDSRTDVILCQPGLTAAVSRLHASLVLVMMMMLMMGGG